MKPEKYTAKQFIDAIRDADGIVTVACRRVGCSPVTFYNYCKKYPSVQKAYDKVKENTDRAVTNKLMEMAFNDGHKDQLSALKYYTACKLGWRVGHDVTTNGKDIHLMKWTDEE